MGHLMLSTMRKIQAAVGELTLEKDGVDGKQLYIYGEAWDFGEVRSSSLLDPFTCNNCVGIYIDTYAHWQQSGNVQRVLHKQIVVVDTVA